MRRQPFQPALPTRLLRAAFVLGAAVLLATLAGLAAAPLASLVSRWSEARADWTALEVSGDAATAVAVERRLALDNRADLRPNRLLVAWFASHPPTMARIAQARLWAAAHPAAADPDGGGPQIS
jgi:STE24 endopeptidase